MVTISNVVNNILNRQVLLRECMNRDIVSYNKLALNLKPEVEAELGKKVKLNSVTMALRRLSEKNTENYSKPSFNYSIETIKTNICYIVFEDSPTLLHKLQNLYSVIDFKKGGILNIIQGNFEVAIIINKKYKNNLLKLTEDEKELEIIDDVVSISLAYPKDFNHTPGILYDISGFMAWENINIVDIVLTKMELNIIVDKKDLMRCYKTMIKFADNSYKKSIKELN